MKGTQRKRELSNKEFLPVTMPGVCFQLWEAVSSLFAQYNVNWVCAFYQKSSDNTAVFSLNCPACYLLYLIIPGLGLHSAAVQKDKLN